MALISCPECKTSVSEGAPACPSCGHPIAAPAPQAVYVPIVPPRQFLAGNFLGCLLLVGGAAWLAFVWLPAHDAAALGLLGTAEAQLREQVVLNERGVAMVRTAALVVALIGLAGLPSSFREVGRAEQCPACKMQVVSRRRLLGRFECERCGRTLSGAFGATVRAVGLVVLVGGVALVGAAVAVDRIAGGQGGARGGADRPPPPPGEPWVSRAATGMRRILSNQTERGFLATSILGITHPSGTEPTLATDTSVEVVAGDTLSVTLAVAWKGGFLGTDYRTTVRWQCRESGHVRLDVLEDNAPVGQTTESLASLDAYFRDEVWRQLATAMQ